MSTFPKNLDDAPSGDSEIARLVADAEAWERSIQGLGVERYSADAESVMADVQRAAASGQANLIADSVASLEKIHEDAQVASER